MSTRYLSFQYELLDNTNTFKKKLYNVESCSISYKFLSQLKSSATIVMDDDSSIDYLKDRIKVYMTLNKVRVALGVFMLCSPSRNITGTKKTRNITAYSLLQILLDDKVTTRYTAVVGTNVVNEVKRLIGNNNSYNIPDSTKTLNSEFNYEIGTSKIEIINDLLASINYTSLWVDKDGVFKAEPYVLPTDKEHVKTYEDNEASIILPDMVDEPDLFYVPNVFVRYTNNLDVATPLSFTYTNNNADSPTSTVNRGRNIVDAQSVEATDLVTLQAITKKAAYEYNSKFSHLSFETAIDPDVMDLYMPNIWIKVGDINAKYTITAITFKCAVGQQSKVESRKVVAI
ncbi:hypothetical protein [Cellulosilyticum lentocellum]|uniref:Uncharacterized protein n=1 Tax=Cellulosilyticum lentocellum (strain ATCC 49066 / DSM 5427 / NCIMB 11756 / RHM5) TaxID=642492 RepID=F2JRA5_CELLD|nr:hypothetical protein [Cellulosilyticum lentocellum]ADZ82714.1 hypothetical protein Clole_0982 [Cellulosilyticum lentocellum DSM 5427]